MVCSVQKITLMFYTFASVLWFLVSGAHSVVDIGTLGFWEFLRPCRWSSSHKAYHMALHHSLQILNFSARQQLDQNYHAQNHSVLSLLCTESSWSWTDWTWEKYCVRYISIACFATSPLFQAESRKFLLEIEPLLRWLESNAFSLLSGFNYQRVLGPSVCPLNPILVARVNQNLSLCFSNYQPYLRVQPYELTVGAEPGRERKRDFVENANGLFSAQASPKPPPALYSITEGMRVGGKVSAVAFPQPNMHRNQLHR